LTGCSAVEALHELLTVPERAAMNPPRRVAVRSDRQSMMSLAPKLESSIKTPRRLDFLSGATDVHHVFSQECRSAPRHHGLSHGLIWPKTGCASIA
jgi:hypothetical protein